MIRLGTRGSALALTQSDFVADRLRAAGHAVERVIVHTRGDASDRPFRELEGKAFFTRELDLALLAGAIDLAVHSLKDLPTDEPDGLASIGVLPRADPRDVLLLRRGIAARTRRDGLPELPAGTRVGTSSARRFAQLGRAFPGVVVADLRGNVPTRVARLRHGDFDAIVIAAAGIDRLSLDLADLDRFALEPPAFLPAPGQGALACRIRAGDAALRAALAPLVDPEAADGAVAERRLLARLDGGCSLPLGALARRTDEGIALRACLARAGRHFEADIVAATPDDAARLAHAVLLRRPIVVLTRPPELDADLVALLRAHDLPFVEQPAIDFGELPTPPALAAALARPGEFAAIAFTSKRAVASWCHHLVAHERPGGAVGRADRPPIAAIGPATAAALRAAGLEPRWIADGRGGAALAALLADALPAGARVLHPGPLEPEGTLAAELAARRISVQPLPLYRTLERTDDPPLPPAPLALLCASPSAARATLRRASLAARRADAPASLRFVATGRTTAAELARLGAADVDIATFPTGEPLLAALSAACAALAAAHPLEATAP